MRIVGVNGILCHGEHNIDLLLAELARRGLTVHDAQLPFRTWVSARWGGCRDGQIVAQAARDGDIVVAHSFGCLRAWNAHKVRDYRAIICIAPAMSDKAEWRDATRVHCYYSRKDWAIRFGARLLFHPFGAAGSKGFRQAGVTNREFSAGHNDYFGSELLSVVADHVERIARSNAL